MVTRLDMSDIVRLFGFMQIFAICAAQYGSRPPPPPFPPPDRPAGPNDPCIHVKNFTDIETLAHHQYVILESCLYYHLRREVNKKHHGGTKNAISMFPPSDGRVLTNTTIIFQKLTFQNIQINDGMQEAKVRGFFEISWRDGRLKWNQYEWKTDVLHIQSPQHIWIPRIATKKHGTVTANGDVVDIKRILLKNGGNVSANINFRLQTYCESDMHNFPADTHECCFELEPKMFADLTQFATNSMITTVDTKTHRERGWSTDGVVVNRYYDEQGLDTLRFCAQLTRNSTTLRAELAIPMALCAILMLISPLFGNFRTQLYAKMFALLLQYMCLEFLATRMAFLGGGTSVTPRIFRFYELTLGINMFSIVCTLIVWVWARAERKLPPSNGMVKFAGLISKFLFCLNSPDIDDSNGDPESGVSASNKNYSKDWLDVSYAFHSMLMFFVIIIYLLGVAVIYM